VERKEYVGKDGLLHCSVCGKAVERIIEMPELFSSGKRKKRKVRFLCSCEIAEQKKMEKYQKFEEEQRRLGCLDGLNIIDKNLRKARFDNYEVTEDNRKGYVFAKKYVENFNVMLKKNQGIMFYGNPGTGKSYTAAAIASELQKNLHTVLMTSFVKVLQELGNFDKKYDEQIEKLNWPKLLILDDFGSERTTDFAVEKLYNVIDGRYRSGKPLIITTNVEFGEMKTCKDMRYRRIYDRIFEMCFPVKIDGLSWRKKEAVARSDYINKMMEG